MSRQLVVIAICASGCAPSAPSASTSSLPMNAAPAAAPVVAASATRNPDEPHQGALCFGGQGPTDIRTFDVTAIRIFEKNETIAEIGSCRIVEGPSQAGFREVTIMEGTSPIATLNHCGGKALVRGISYGVGVQLGDSTRRLAALTNLECRADIGGYWCYGASEHDPTARYFVSVPGSTTAAGGVAVQGPAAVALIAGKTIAGASFTTRCD